MKILYIGDIMGEVGVEVVAEQLPQLQQEHNFDLVIAQSENVTNGKGMSSDDMGRLQEFGIQFFTGGNHTPSVETLHPLLENPDAPVIGPANMVDCPGHGWKYSRTPKGRVLVISLLGSTVGREVTIENPLQVIDAILHQQVNEERVATAVNFHGDFSSEKVIIGHYLDGRVSAVIGDHWHVPTADAGIMPRGTAHITDVGMCGVLDASLGVTLDSVVPRWRDGVQTRNVLETAGRRQFNALLVETDEQTGRAVHCEHIRRVYNA